MQATARKYSLPVPPLTVGVGEMAVATRSGQVIQTLALGSCLALAAFCSTSGVAGMAHLVLPDSSTDTKRGQELAAYYVDTGIPALFRAMRQKGAVASQRRYELRLAGGARMLNMNGAFDVGNRNIGAAREALQSLGCLVCGALVGGKDSRNISIEAGSGQVRLWSASRGEMSFKEPRKV